MTLKIKITGLTYCYLQGDSKPDQEDGRSDLGRGKPNLDEGKPNLDEGKPNLDEGKPNLDGLEEKLQQTCLTEWWRGNPAIQSDIHQAIKQSIQSTNSQAVNESII